MRTAKKTTMKSKKDRMMQFLAEFDKDTGEDATKWVCQAVLDKIPK